MFGTAGIFVRFAIAYPARAAIVNQVTTGTIKPERDTGYGPEATLRAWYWPLASALNKVNIEQDEGRFAIIFADVLGVTDNYSAFVYISDDSPPRDKDFGGDVIGYARVVPHWYYVTFT